MSTPDAYAFGPDRTELLFIVHDHVKRTEYVRDSEALLLVRFLVSGQQETNPNLFKHYVELFKESDIRHEQALRYFHAITTSAE